MKFSKEGLRHIPANVMFLGHRVQSLAKNVLCAEVSGKCKILLIFLS